MPSPYNLQLQHDCTTCVLREGVAFCDLSESPLASLNEIKYSAPYPRGATLFVEGETPRGVFILCQGKAKLTTSSRDGRTLILKIAGPGEILGLSAAILGTPYEVTVETTEPSQITFVRETDFLSLMDRHPEFARRAAVQLSRNCQEAQRELRSLGLSHTTSEKLARLILDWATEGEQTPRGVRVRVVLTHEEIGQMLGTTRETVTRLFGDLKRKRVIDVQGSSVYVTKIEALQELVA